MSPMTPSIADLIDELSALLDTLQGDPWNRQPLPWTVWTSCSFRRIGCDQSQKDGDVLHALNHASDGHPDLSMREDRLKAWVGLTNALPTLLDALKSLQAERDEAVTRLAEVLESLAYRGSLLCRETARADAAQETIGRYREALDDKRLPRLTRAMIEAACAGHYGKERTRRLGISGIYLTCNDHTWSFEAGFRRMWRGLQAYLDTQHDAALETEGAER